MENISLKAKKFIRELESGNVYILCPCCNKPINAKNAGLFYLNDMTLDAQKIYEQQQEELKDRERYLKKLRKTILQKSEIAAKSTNIGFILERIAPSMPGFKFDRNDCRSLFDPIDYVIFEGLDKKGAVSRIIFSDIKTGAARLSPKQREIKELVENKKVEWDTYKQGKTNEK